MRFRLFLVIALLILGMLSVSLNVNDTYGDSILMFTVHRVAGGDEVVTENLIKERCFVHAQIDVYSAHHRSFHRNNLDKMFYPGDAFDYQVSTWKMAVERSGSHVQ